MPESTMPIGEASVYTGVPIQILRRRADAWISGDRSPTAVKSSRTLGTRGWRYVDRRDAERVRLQTAGELDASVTAVQWAAGVR